MRSLSITHQSHTSASPRGSTHAARATLEVDRTSCLPPRRAPSRSGQRISQSRFALFHSLEREREGREKAPNMVVVQGPGFTIERIAGFSVDGNPYDTPGNSTDLALVFEHIPPAFGVDTDGIALAQAFAEQQAGVFSPRALSLILRKTNGTEVGRWNLYEAAPVTMTVGTDGRDRYRWQSQIAPPAVAAFEFAGGTFDATLADAFDPDEDSRVEVSGIGDYFPKVSDDAANRLLTMTLFFDETESLYQWARDARNGSAGAKRSLSVVTLDPVSMAEVARRNYFGAFPVSYRLVSGFSQPARTVIEVVLSYDVAEDV